MNYSLIICSFLFVSPTYQKLTWDDFMGKPVKSRDAAMTVTNIELTEKGAGGLYEFEVKLEFDKGASWTATTDPAKLRHEQGHFDISWIAYQDVIKALLPYQNTSKLKEAERVYDKMIRQWELRQRRYDLETNHSLDISAQNRWNDTIRRELATSCIF